MKRRLLVGIPVLSAGLYCGLAAGQRPATTHLQDSSQPAARQVAAPSKAPPYVPPGTSPVPLDWTPPALAQLSSVAEVKSSFTLDRSLLGVAAGMVPESEPETRRAINELEGVSVHLLRFANAGMEDEEQVDAVREAYHLRGWKHLVTTTRAGGPVHSGTTDVWLVLDGVNVRGAVVLAETPRSLTLVTVAGDLSPIDLLHLRGHFGIPHFDGDGIRGATRQ
ncbi:MAG: hypothetical protein KGM96_05590 [Acidobacteriota bacterium]|nr:hypothetical protein [Acidobacteriota bacterium]